jgi:hypothetical protein
MSNKSRLVDLKAGDKFRFNDKEHARIADERVSCCVVYNAKIIATGEKVQIAPITEVELID